MVVRRGEIWWAGLADPRGSEPGYRRPVVVVQSDAFNRSQIQTVIVAVVTSNTQLSRAPGNVVVSLQESGLPRESVVNVSQLITLDKRFLTERVGRLSPELTSEVDRGLRLALAV